MIAKQALAGEEDRHAVKEPGVAQKIYFLLSKGQRRRLFLLLPAVIAAGLMQVVGIASIMPFLGLLTDPDAVYSDRLLHWLYTTLNFADLQTFLIFLGAAVLVALAVSNGFTALTTWALDRFVWGQNYRLSRLLLDDYLHRPYAFYLTRNTAGLSRNILSEVQAVVQNILLPGIHMIATATVVIFILVFLILVDPLLAISAALALGGAYALVFVLVRRKLGRLGKERVEANQQLFQIAGEAFGGIKDVKLLGKEEDFIRQFSAPAKLYASHMATSHVISTLPRYAIEVIAFGGILLIVLYLLVLGRDMSQVLPLLGLYAFASYRLMPALQQIFHTLAKTRAFQAALDALYRDVRYESGEKAKARIDRDKIPALPFKNELELRDITFFYAGAEAPLFEGFHLSVKAYSSVALVGATGSGKTTAIDLILGLIRPEHGQLLVDGVEISDDNLANWQKNLGYVPQHIYLFDKSVACNIAFGVSEENIDMAAVERAAKTANIHDFILELPQGYQAVVGERGLRLSGGQRQRIGIARALYHDPEVLVLDEATSALDGVTEESVFKAMDELSGRKTIIMIAHRISTVRNCDVIYLLDKGRVVARGGYEELLASSSQFRAIAQVSEEMKESTHA